MSHFLLPGGSCRSRGARPYIDYIKAKKVCLHPLRHRITSGRRQFFLPLLSYLFSPSALPLLPMVGATPYPLERTAYDAQVVRIAETGKKRATTTRKTARPLPPCPPPLQVFQSCLG